MKSLLDRTRRELGAFLEQRGELALVICCGDNDAPLLLQILRELDTESGADLFLLFGGHFDGPERYVSGVIEQLERQRDTASHELEQQGRPALPPVPVALRDETRPALDRLKAALLYAQSLLPPGPGHRLAWAMIPQSVQDRAGLLSLVTGLVAAPLAAAAPWTRRTRVFARDVAGPADASHPLHRAGIRRMRTMPLDLGPQAIEQAFIHEAEDASLPLAARMEALLSSAMLDVAQNRPAPAIEKLNVLLGYFQSTDSRGMQAVVMTGIGDLFRRQGVIDRAQHWYECALGAASDGQVPVVLVTIVRNLGEIAYEQRRYAEAEQYFEGLDRLTTKTLDADSRAGALEWLGKSRYQLKKYALAVQSWEAAVKLCRSLEMDARLKSTLQRLRALYEEAGMKEERRGIDVALAQAGAGGGSGHA